ncbi:MAG: LuxR C-terminal-related transcriptional regulator [Myxococcota bacterium]|nr:LuxR C-terminal-related transcriptional regulator [Myxococcota bacterium]
MLGYQIDVDDDGYRLHHPVTAGTPTHDVVAEIRAMAKVLDDKRAGRAGLIDRAKARLYEAVFRTGLAEPADHLLQSEQRRVGPEWLYKLRAPLADAFVLANHHVDGNGATAVFGALKEPRAFHRAERAMFHMLSAHIKAGLRLRRRLPQASRSVDAPAGGAVLTGSGRLLHAEGDARGEDSANDLRESASRIDRARSQSSGRGDEALAVWQGLVHGRWSLVEQFDADGRRFMLAHRNPEDVRDPRGLSMMEVRVVGLAVRGYSDKLIAYHLGIAEGTVSSHLTHAMSKLKIANRVALVRQLGTRFPQEQI